MQNQQEAFIQALSQAIRAKGQTAQMSPDALAQTLGGGDTPRSANADSMQAILGG